MRCSMFFNEKTKQPSLFQMIFHELLKMKNITAFSNTSLDTKVFKYVSVI